MKLVYNDTAHSYWLGGKRVKSASKVAKISADGFTIEQWQKRQVAIGMTLDPSLAERVAVDLDNREAIQQVCEDAAKAAKAGARAERGTQRHRVFELLLLGQRRALVTDQQRRDAEVLARTLDAYGLTPIPDRVEQFVAWPDHGVVGRYDAYLMHEGRPVLVDLKGGINAVKYPHSTAVQLALYRFAPLTSAAIMRDGDRSEVTEWTTAPDGADEESAYVLYCDDDHDVGELWRIDLTGGRVGADLALSIVDWRKSRSYGKDLATPIPTDDLCVSVPVEQEPRQQQPAVEAALSGEGAPIAPDEVGAEAQAGSGTAGTASAQVAPPSGVDGTPEIVDPFGGNLAGTLDGVFTDLATGAVEHKPVRYEVRLNRDDEEWVHLLDGPTGYESAPIEMIARMEQDPATPGWAACFGTKGRYRELLITRDSLLREFSNQVADPAPPAVDRPAPETAISGAKHAAPGGEHGRRQVLLQRYRALNDDDKRRYLTLGAKRNDLDAVEAALDAVEPFNNTPPRQPAPAPTLPPEPRLRFTGDEGRAVDGPSIAGMRMLFDALTPEQREPIAAIVVGARDTVGGFLLSELPSVRRWEIYRGLIFCAQFGWTDELVRDLLAAATDDLGVCQPAVPLGVAVGMLDVAQAEAFAGLAAHLSVKMAVAT